MKRQKEIYRQLEEKGFAATNLVLGIGSFTYQCATRDNLGLAMKATYCEIDGVGKEIFKDPKTVTASGMTKKSLRGLIKVVNDGDTIKAIDRVTAEEESAPDNLLLTVFEDGKLVREVTLDEIRKTRNDFSYFL